MRHHRPVHGCAESLLTYTWRRAQRDLVVLFSAVGFSPNADKLKLESRTAAGETTPHHEMGGAPRLDEEEKSSQTPILIYLFSTAVAPGYKEGSQKLSVGDLGDRVRGNHVATGMDEDGVGLRVHWQEVLRHLYEVKHVNQSVAILAHVLEHVNYNA